MKTPLMNNSHIPVVDYYAHFGKMMRRSAPEPWRSLAKEISSQADFKTLAEMAVEWANTPCSQSRLSECSKCGFHGEWTNYDDPDQMLLKEFPESIYGAYENKPHKADAYSPRELIDRASVLLRAEAENGSFIALWRNRLETEVENQRFHVDDQKSEPSPKKIRHMVCFDIRESHEQVLALAEKHQLPISAVLRLLIKNALKQIDGEYRGRG